MSALGEVCGSVGAVQQGKQVHVEIRETGSESNLLLEVYCVVMQRNWPGFGLRMVGSTPPKNLTNVQ